MQNIQDVENSKKISAIKDEVVKTTEMSLIEHHLNDSEDQDEHDDTEPNRIHQFKEVNVPTFQNPSVIDGRAVVQRGWRRENSGIFGKHGAVFCT